MAEGYIPVPEDDEDITQYKFQKFAATYFQVWMTLCLCQVIGSKFDKAAFGFQNQLIPFENLETY